MPCPPPSPVFTLRGHRVGVTALVCCEPSTLYSGDEDGNIATWDLTTFKQVGTLTNVCKSKILTLKIVRLILDGTDGSDVLVIQSRNDGVYIKTIDTLRSLTTFPTYQSLFSRGDAIQIRDEAVLAYPSAVESYLVTVRYIGKNAETLVSGSAHRQDEDKARKQSAVFDIQIKLKDLEGEFLLFTAYEDGCMVIYGFNRARVQTVPDLNLTGLKLDILRKLDFGIHDFVSAFDVAKLIGDTYMLICGSPKKELILTTLRVSTGIEVGETNTVILSKPGTSVISIRTDRKLVTVANWDCNIRMFSTKSRLQLVTLKNHLKQISALMYVTYNSEESKILTCCGSLDGTISIFDIYN